MPYINTIDINGETYHLKNLTDGDYVVDLPDLNKSDIFVVRGDIVNGLTSYQTNKPLSASQGRILNEKNSNLSTTVSTLKTQLENKDSELESKDSELDGKISQLRTDMETNDSSTLSTAKSYTDEQSAEAVSTAKQYTDSNCETINGTITTLQGIVDNNKKSLDDNVASLTTLIGAKSSETLTAANNYTDGKCTTINKTIGDLRKTIEDNKSSADSGAAGLRTYVDSTFIEKTKIVDNLTTDSKEQVLSAKQGKALEDKKVDKVSGKSLSTNDYTTAEKNKLGAIESEANKYVHPTYTEQSSGLYKITVDATGHVCAVTAATKEDIVALGIPSQDTVYTLPQATDTSIGGVKISSDYTTNASDDCAASTSAVKSVYDSLKEYIDGQIAALSGTTT